MKEISDEKIEAMAEESRKEVSTEFILKNEEDAFDLGFEKGFKARDKLTPMDDKIVLSKDEFRKLLREAYVDATGIYEKVHVNDWWGEFKLHNNLKL